MFWGARGRYHLWLIALVYSGFFAGPARAVDADIYREIETKYIFGFTTGSGIGLEGEKEFTVESVGRFGKRTGRYAATETKYEFEFTPSQLIQIEFGALGATHNVSNVMDLDDRRQMALSGAFAEFRYLAIERTDSQPLAVTLSFEPTWRRIDETGGEKVQNYEFETKINADLELVKNRVYAGFNLLYEPETTKTLSGELEREAKIGVSSALAVRVHPNLVLGAEVWYLRHYDSLGLSEFTGDAVLLGPTLYWQLSRKTFLTAAWNAQVAGHEVGGVAPLNLAEFQRHRVRLKYAVEF